MPILPLDWHPRPLIMLLSIFTALFALSPFTTTATTTATSLETPTPPALEFLYTAFVHCTNTLYESQGPRGIRKAIPIVGGNFTGPRVSGTIANLGADWGLVDPQTGLFSADTRYNLKTDDGEYLFLQTSGASVPAGGLHLRVLIETGSAKYYWLNNLVAVGVLQRVSEDEEGFVLRIDVWHVSERMPSAFHGI